MSEYASYTPSYQPTPRIPSLWERVMNRAKADIEAAGGLGGKTTLCSIDTSNWLGTEQRASLLKESLASSLVELSTGSDSTIFAAGGEQIVEFRAMLKALGNLPQLAAITQLRSGETFARLREESVNIFEEARKSGATSQLIARAKTAQASLRTITGHAHQHLAKAEGDMLQEMTCETLRHLGYSLSEKDQALRAVRGTTCIWIEIDDHGRMSLDASGFSGLTCQTEIKALENGLREKGVELKRSSSNMHGQKAGSTLAGKLAGIFDTPNQTGNGSTLWGKPATGLSRGDHATTPNRMKGTI